MVALVAPNLAVATIDPADDGCGEIWCARDNEFDGTLDSIDLVDVVIRPDPRKYAYTSKCFTEYYTAIADYCDPDGFIPRPDLECSDDVLLPPRWSRLATEPDSRWTLDRNFTCPGDDGYPLEASDFKSLPIEPSELQIQPGNGWVFAGLETVAFAGNASQGFRTSLLGQEFHVVAVPHEFTWDFGDGSSPLVTADPGQPWPDHTVSHVYDRAGEARVSLTTTWRGHFRLAHGSTWTEVDGTAVTTTSGPILTVHTARTRLVEDSLD